MSFAAEDFKTSIYPPDTMDYLGLVITGIIIIIATLAGTAGNSQLFTIILVFFRMHTEAAVAQTSLFGLVSSGVRLIYEVVSGGGNSSTKRINFHIVLVSAPWIMIGTLVGIHMSNLTPKALRFASIMLLFGYMSFQGFKTLISKCRVELQHAERSEQNEYLIERNLKASDEGNIVECDHKSNTSIAEMIPDQLQDNQQSSQHYEKDGIIVPIHYSPYGSTLLGFESSKYIQMQTNAFDKISFLFIILATPSISLIRGVGATRSIIGIDHCSMEDIAICSISFIILASVSYLNTKSIIQRNKRSAACSNQIKFNFKNTTGIIISSFIIGLLGSWLGVAASTMSNLYLLSLGLNPFVGGPTSLAIVFLTSGSSSILFFLDGIIDIPTFVICSLIIIIVSIITRFTVYNMMVKAKKTSIPVLFVFIITVISVPGIVFKMLPPIIQDLREGVDIMKFNFPSLCK